MKRLISVKILLLLLLASNAFAIPPIEVQYSAAYQDLREKIDSKDIEIMKDAYLTKNDFLKIVSQPQVTQMEVYLTDVGSGYGFFNAESSLQEMEELIERTQSPKYVMEAPQKELILGDAYHWLGHVYEEKGELIKAYECYVRSFVHYQKTPLKTSPRINQALVVQEHGEFHLKDIVSTIKTMVSLPGFRSAMCASAFN